MVPKRALEREGERRYLLLARPEPGGERRATVERVEVREGFAEDDWIEVLPAEGGELEAGVQVIVVGGRDLKEGDTVRVDAVREDPGTESGRNG